LSSEDYNTKGLENLSEASEMMLDLKLSDLLVNLFLFSTLNLPTTPFLREIPLFASGGDPESGDALYALLFFGLGKLKT